MNKSESIKNLAVSLGKFHAEMGKVIKSETNPFFKSKYADLSTILGAIKEPLANAGLVFTQFPDGINQLTTILMDTASGEWLEATYEMTPAKNDPQGQGSVITYQRRYALGAVLGLNIDEDDDGNKASGKIETKMPGEVKAFTSQGYPMKETPNTSNLTQAEMIKKRLTDIIKLGAKARLQDVQDAISGTESTEHLTDDEKSSFLLDLKIQLDDIKANPMKGTARI